MAIQSTTNGSTESALALLHPTVRHWFTQTFPCPTVAQQRAWPAIASGDHTLLLAPTGSGKTLAAFLTAIDRIMFSSDSPQGKVRVLYISPLKALGVDVERNLRSPIAGVRAVAERDGTDFHLPRVGVRSGDTPAADRRKLNRDPPDILITTPESLYLLLTSQAREALTGIQTVIIDEIHSMVSTKRGAHLFLSLERLEHLRKSKRDDVPPMQRIGLSATQRPLDEIARLLGGAAWMADRHGGLQPREVRTVEAMEDKQIDLRIEVPVEDMSDLTAPGPAASGPAVPSIWPSIHPRLVELIRQHRSTMIFVNSRRLAERLATAINEEAQEPLARAHHGSISKATRLEIEDQLKRGKLPAIVATSSLELGIDMGAVDLVIQVEAPPSIASGIQRIGRAGHQVGARSVGVVFPKHRGDLLASSAVAQQIHRGEVEATYYPRNPLDVLAQQIVAMASLESVPVDEVFEVVRQAAPFHDLPRTAFEGVLDLLSGRYPSDEFSELRARVNWDRLNGLISPRRGTQRLAIVNAGTIPDRGLYGVYLAGDDGKSNRVGELDEEMVFETQVGDVFLLGASSWRVMDITSDRVLVSPAPGEPGRMPFWRGDGPGRPLEFGRAIGRLTRELLAQPDAKAERQLIREQGLDATAAKNLIQYLQDQVAATGEAPTDRTLVVESFLDEVGDWRVAILSPFGGRIHAPWATAVAARLRSGIHQEIDMMWSDDGIVFRLPESDELPGPDELFPDPDDIEELLTNEIGGTALFAARFRENAARALLLPRRQPGRRTPLWLQRRRAADLLDVASRFPSFPILMETYRECLRDVFDMKGLKQILRDVQQREISVHTSSTQSASPFASSMLFGYTAKFIYEGDTPLAERRAQALALDHSQLRELLGDADLRDLLDVDAVAGVGLELQRLDERFLVKHEDGLLDLLRHLGDLSRDEIRDRVARSAPVDDWIEQLIRERRAIEISVTGDTRFAAAEDAGRLRDALGIMPPSGLPEAFLEPADDPLVDLVSRFARTHLPFKIGELAQRWSLGVSPVRAALIQLVTSGRLLEGEFLPGRQGSEWCDANVLRMLKRRSLASLRKQIEPVEQQALASFLPVWQGITQPRRGLDGLLDVVQQLQGVPLPASVWEQDVVARRVVDYRPADLDELCAAGEIIWRGFGSLGNDDGRIALYLTGHFMRLAPPAELADHELAPAIRECLIARGAQFFDDLASSTGEFRNDVLEALWQLVWSGEVSNDTLAPLRSFRDRRQRQKKRVSRRHTGRPSFRSRREAAPPGSEGRWSLLIPPGADEPSETQRKVAQVEQLIDRYGVLTRELIRGEGIRGGFAGVYPILKAMEESGKVRRGYFVAGLGAAQFAAPGAEDRLREKRETDETTLLLAATDPANPYGTAVAWPAREDVAMRPQRAAGAHVILDAGKLIGFLGRTGQQLLTFLPVSDMDRKHAVTRLAESLAERARAGDPVLLAGIDGDRPLDSALVPYFEEAGFIKLSRGILHRGLPVPD